MNDIFNFVHNSTVYNNADDNTFFHKDAVILKSTIQTNQMQANPDKFQTIFTGTCNNLMTV